MVAGSGATMCTRSGRSFQSCRKASLSMPQIDHPGCPAQGALVSVTELTHRPPEQQILLNSRHGGERGP